MMSPGKITWPLVIVLASGLPAARATVLTFDGLPGDGSALYDGYGGFDWNNGATVGSLDGVHYGQGGSGYYFGTISGPNIAYNWWGNGPVDITSVAGHPFTFNGAYFTSAWYDQEIRFEGLRQGVMVDSSVVYSITTTTPVHVDLDWSGIDELVIYNSGSQWDTGNGQWAMDNFTFNGDSPAIPEPLSLALFGLGMAGLLGSWIGARRNRSSLLR